MQTWPKRAFGRPSLLLNPQWGALAAGLFSSGMLVAALLRHPGLPGFLHDWQWPAYAGLLRSFTLSKLSAWDWIGLGGPNLSLQVHPYYVFIFLCSTVMGTNALLVLVLSAVVGLAAYAMGMLAIGYGARSFTGSFLCGCLFALSPFTANELVAGHIEVLASAFALPWVLFASNRDRGKFAPLLALALAWCGLHLQFFLLAILILVLFEGFAPFRRMSWSLVLVLATLAPSLWTLYRGYGDTGEDQLLTSVPWMQAQSYSFEDAITGAHYFTHYWETITSTIPAAQWVQWAYPAAILLGLVISRMRAVRVAACAAFAVLVLWGMNGPLGGPMQFMVRHFSAFSAFRELYHIAVLIPLSAALATALIAGKVPRAFLVFAAAAIVALLAIPFAAGRVLELVPTVNHSSKDATSIAKVAPGLPPTRIFLAPGFSPVGQKFARAGGADPFAFRDGDELPLWQYRPSGLMPSLIWEIESNKLSSSDARLFAIGLIAARPNLESKLSTAYPIPDPVFSGDPAGKGWKPIGRYDGLNLGRYHVNEPILQLAQTVRPSGHRSSRAFDLVAGVDPRVQWAPAQDWWFLSPVVASVAPTGAITYAADAVLRPRCDSNGASRSFDFRQITISGGQIGNVKTAHVACGGQRIANPGGHYSIAAPIMPAEEAASIEGLASGMRDYRLGLASVQASSSIGCERCFVFLSETWDAGWHASVGRKDLGPGRPVAKGFGIFWAADRVRDGARITATYSPQDAAFCIESVASIAWLSILLMIVVPAIKTFQRPRNSLWACYAPRHD